MDEAHQGEVFPYQGLLRIWGYDLRYCPTDVMWADVQTKPLQGQKFRDMRAFLQNCPRDYDDDVELNTDQLA